MGRGIPSNHGDMIRFEGSYPCTELLISALLKSAQVNDTVRPETEDLLELKDLVLPQKHMLF